MALQRFRTFAVLPFMVILTNYWRVHVRNAYRATRQRLSLINGYLNESISGMGHYYMIDKAS